MPGTMIGSLFGNINETRGQKLKTHYRLVVMGAAKVGKTAIVQQFLYDTFPVNHCATVEELYRGEYDIGKCEIVLDILDTSGSYEFPAMRHLAITTGDAFVLVYAIDDPQSFEEVGRLREMILDIKSTPAPIVVVGNKSDLRDSRLIKKEVAETVINLDWENGFAEVSAKENENIMDIFKELLIQANLPCDINRAGMQNRRKSLPAIPTNIRFRNKTMLKRNSCIIS